MKTLVVTAIAGVLLTAAVLGMHSTSDRVTRPGSTVSVVDALAGPTAGFTQAVAPRAFRFPADHGPHPGFRSEWWYYTGNLATAAGRRFGYQLTIFRIGLAAGAPRRASAWATDSAWMAHFALTDVAGDRFVATSRLARGALGLAGAAAAPFHVWVEDWAIRGLAPDVEHPPMRLVAAAGDIAIDLELTAGKPPVFHGDRGLSRKGSAPGNASYYYSLTRLGTRGHVRVGGTRVDVTGTSWMDREWSTSALETGQVGWDWFALTLDDGRELMFYRLRRADGSADPFSAGTLVAADGKTTPLGPADVTLDAIAHWTSPHDGTRYPSRWRLHVPAHAVQLEISPRVADQEWTEPVRYWEGAVDVRGTAGSRAITGDGYVELVGYAPATRAPRVRRLVEPHDQGPALPDRRRAQIARRPQQQRRGHRTAMSVRRQTASGVSVCAATVSMHVRLIPSRSCWR